MLSDLGRGETHSGGGIHGLCHVFGKVDDIKIDIFYLVSLGFEDTVGIEYDFFFRHNKYKIRLKVLLCQVGLFLRVYLLGNNGGFRYFWYWEHLVLYLHTLQTSSATLGDPLRLWHKIYVLMEFCILKMKKLFL